VNYRLCADLDGGFKEQGFLDVGHLGGALSKHSGLGMSGC
jgi:hypothetical protein